MNEIEKRILEQYWRMVDGLQQIKDVASQDIAEHGEHSSVSDYWFMRIECMNARIADAERYLGYKPTR